MRSNRSNEFCNVKRCNAESVILMMDGSGLCQKHWLKHCKERKKDNEEAREKEWNKLMIVRS